MKTTALNKRSKKLLAFFMALIMALTSFPLFAFATDESGVRPEDGTSYGSPFVSGVAGSDNFRIPQIVTMNDGTLVAQADARWDAQMDGGGNDSIIARSEDGGNTWEYSMLTYYPDNGNRFDKSSTSICDSALATDGDVLYSLSTFFPAGYALNGSSADHQVSSGVSAFDGNGRLLLSRNGSGLNYYLGDFSSEDYDGVAYIYDSNNNPVAGYTVDHDLYLYNNGTKSGNLFYSDCEFQTAKTTFLLFRKSTDSGKTWSPFSFVNVKSSDEAFYGVGPGRGVVTPQGYIVFGAYTWDGSNGSQRSSFIYSKDGGKTWTRMSNLPGLKYWIDYTFTTWTSECQPVLLDDGTIRLFCRSGRRRIIYADAKLDQNNNYYWVENTSTGDFPVHLDAEFNGQYFDITENNQYSVIEYSKKVLWNGNYYNMLIASHANGGGASRTEGTLTFILTNTNNDVVNAVQTKYTSGAFGYSCLTELPDGRVGMLYEYTSDQKGLQFVTFDVEEVSGFRVPDLKRTYDVSLVRHDTQTYYVSEGQETSNTDSTIASTEFDPQYSTTASMGSDSSFTGEHIPLTDALYTFTETPDGTWYVGNMGVYLTIDTPGQPSTKDRAPITIREESGGLYYQFIDSRNEALYFWREDSSGKIYQFDQTTAWGSGAPDGDQHFSQTLFEIYRPARVNETTSANDPVPGYIKVTSIDELDDGGQYLIGCQVNGDYYFLYPALGSSNIYAHTVKSNKTYEKTGYYMTITALKGGNTTIVCGNNTYNVEVSDYSREITGIVDYDPVIYTQGTETDITSFGSVIADGSVEGEKYTDYRLNDSSYTILEVEAVNSFNANNTPIAGSNIDASDGRLKGTLSLANTSSYNAYDSGTYVTLKTTLRDSTGLIWTQTDRLYVASSPVPGHVIIGNFNRRTQPGWSGGVNLATFVMAYGSYGNTTMLPRDLGSSYIGNAKILFPTTSNYFKYNNAIEEIANVSSALGDYKYAGAPENGKYEGWSNQSHTITYIADDKVNASGVTVAYYYYDKSSDYNQGITVNESNPTEFSINFERMPVDSQYSPDSGWTKNVTVNSSSVTKLSGSGKITNNTALFGTDGYTILDSNHRKTGTVQLSSVDENGTDAVLPNTTASLKGVVQYQETATRTDGRATSTNKINLTFEVKMCDKSNERKLYEKSIATPRKSTWYTTDSWYNYMQSLLIYQEYLNNYTLLTTDANRQKYNPDSQYPTYSNFLYNDETHNESTSTITLSYEHLTKRADFSKLENALQDYQHTYEEGIVDAEKDVTYTPDSFIAFEKAYEAGELFMEDYVDEDIRNNTPGYVVGPDVDTKNPANRVEVQEKIENLADAITHASLVVAADDSAYVAAKEESERIDLTAYKDNGDKIQEIKDTSDGLIYKEYPKNSGITYVNIPYDIDNGPEDTVTDDGQQAVDGYTKDLLTEMNVGSDASSPQVKTFHVDYTINGEAKDTDETLAGTVTTNDYHYGEIANIDLSDYNSEQYTVKVTLNSETGNKDETTYNLEDHDYKISMLIQEDITVKVEVTENDVITVQDYYGTVLGYVYIPEGGATVTIDADNNLIIHGTTIAPKESPRYNFTGWSVKTGDVITEETVIRQRGTLNSGEEKIITAVNGTVNNKDEFRTIYFDMKLDLAAADGSVWTRTVDGKEYLASYEPSFVAFTSNEDVTYTAYSPEALPDSVSDQFINQIPAVYGTGYFANNAFTLSIDYSAPVLNADGSGVKVVETGVICSNNANSTAETLVKGGEGAVTVRSNRISHWNGHNNSGTYTMTLANSDTGTFYMRAYVSYTKAYDDNTTVPYVVYSDRIFKCENGAVTAVN